MDCSGFQYSTHAVKRMLDKKISIEEIEQCVLYGEIIKEYPDDKPYPSKLFVKFVRLRPIHVVAAQDENAKCIIITCYEPDSVIWLEDFKTKKS